MYAQMGSTAVHPCVRSGCSIANAGYEISDTRGERGIPSPATLSLRTYRKCPFHMAR
jgi:hypothetical protein